MHSAVFGSYWEVESHCHPFFFWLFLGHLMNSLCHSSLIPLFSFSSFCPFSSLVEERVKGSQSFLCFCFSFSSSGSFFAQEMNPSYRTQ